MTSLITSLYKSEMYLDKYLETAQGFADFLLKNGIDFEIIIIVNDASEKEKEKLEKFKAIYSWMRVFYVPREPLYASWNRGVDLAKYDIIGFWNADDIRYPEAIIDAINLVKNGADLVYFPFIIKWYLKIFGISFLVRRRIIHPPEFNQEEFTRSMHCGPLFLFRKSLYEKVGPFDEQFRIVGDFDWCVRAAKATDKFVLSDKIAGVFKVDKTSGVFGISGIGLSGGRGNKRHIAENNIVYLRHDIKEKVQPADEDLMKGYNQDKIVYKNK